MTIVARGADAVGSLHRYVTIIDSDGAVYLVGFGDATDSGYLTSDGRWGNGRDLPETMEFGSVMAAYYNDNTEGVNNLALLQTLAGVGVTFEATMLVLRPNVSDNPSLFTPAYSCVGGILHAFHDSEDLGFIRQVNFPGYQLGAFDCNGGVTANIPGGYSWFNASDPSLLCSVSSTAIQLYASWNTLIMILTGHINYTWPST